jgi:uncharacterized surface protein with fasciclin (FAS1) repeats
MKRYIISAFAAGAAMMIGGALAAVSGNAPAPKPAEMSGDVANPMIGGQAMLPSRTLLDNISASPDHSALVAAMKDSGVADALKANGQFTVFAPTNAAMGALSAQALSGNKAQLAKLMGYLVVPGRYDSQSLLKAISDGAGQAKLRTVEGGVILARMNGPTNIILVDEQGMTADIAIYDVYDKNGVMHVVDRMLEPGSAGSSQIAASR